MRLLLPLLAIIMNCYSHSFIPHDPTQSTRDVQLKILSANGCTNRLVALQVIDFYQSGLSSVTLFNKRLDQLSGPFTTATLTKW